MRRMLFPLTLIGRRVLLALIMLALCAALLVGTQTKSASAASWSFVRIFHASPDAGIVDVFMDGSQILSNFQYGTFTSYKPVVAGSHSIQIAVLGKGANAAFLTQRVSLQAGTPYTIVAVGTKATGFALHVFADNNSVAGNLAKVRIYHLSPGAGVVDVGAKGTMLISGLPYAQASNYVSVSPGSYTFDVTTTQNNASSSVTAQLKPWTVTSIFAISPLNKQNSTSQLQFIQDQIAGTPGMPGTGSDPNAASSAAPVSSSAPLSWPLPMLAILAGAGAIVVSRRAKGKLFSRER